ncbi:MAG: M20/M25/M40 family metallo-hydrolase, partial [Bifidobacteriaceae bacterium]|nr:M20/M25/M40 family metallo-hydrolase [Bifidobacteriaceae bacterium]
MDTTLGQDAVNIAQDLIRIDTTNTGGADSVGEREAAEYVLGQLQDLGYQPHYIESEPRRGSLLLRLEGVDSSRPALVLHGHLDVVPANRTEWSDDPFGAEIKDGELWGRGAVDMKGMDGMILAVLRHWQARGVKPPRDLIVAFFADEEAGGKLGSHWLVTQHPEWFHGATEAVGEVGGFSVEVAGKRAYLLQTAEKGIAWLRLVAQGTPGHGSAVNSDNAVEHLVEALAAIAAHPWPLELTPTVRALLQGVAQLVDIPADLEDPAIVDQLIQALGPAQRFVGASIRTGANLTSLQAGSKVNVVPLHASATVDFRPLPGCGSQVIAQVEQLAGSRVKVEIINDDVGLEAPIEVPLVDAMRRAVQAADPGAFTLPYMLAGG